jgi:pyruvate kinase
MATTWTAIQMHAKAIISLTESGSTALMMSRTVTHIPIYALTRHEKTRRRMSLCRDVFPVDFDPSMLDSSAPLREAEACMLKRGVIAKGDRVLMTKGDKDRPGGTNAMKIVTVGE